MPLFHRKNDEEKDREREVRERSQLGALEAKESLEALQQGGIPLHAQRRLTELRSRTDGFFTSDLSVNEFILARKEGLRPLSQVMGSSMYHVGWRNLGRNYNSGEIVSVTEALNQVRTLALGRLAEEAQAVGADVVVGVRVERKNYDWSADTIEFSAIGTAMSLDRPATGDAPSLTGLSGGDFWKLYTAGYWPVGLEGGSSVFHAVPSWGTWRATNTFRGGMWNQELTDFTQGLYTARHRASMRMSNEAQGFQAAGVVGVWIDQRTEEFEVNLGNDQERTDMIVTFQMLGTAIVPTRRPAQDAPKPVQSISLT